MGEPTEKLYSLAGLFLLEEYFNLTIDKGGLSLRRGPLPAVASVGIRGFVLSGQYLGKAF